MPSWSVSSLEEVCDFVSDSSRWTEMKKNMLNDEENCFLCLLVSILEDSPPEQWINWVLSCPRVKWQTVDSVVKWFIFFCQCQNLKMLRNPWRVRDLLVSFSLPLLTLTCSLRGLWGNVLCKAASEQHGYCDMLYTNSCDWNQIPLTLISLKIKRKNE